MRREKVVDLKWAFCWVCPDCGAKNYTEGVTCQFSPEEIAEMERHFGIGFVDGEWESKPDSVECIRCEEEFAVQPDPEPAEFSPVDDVMAGETWHDFDSDGGSDTDWA